MANDDEIRLGHASHASLLAAAFGGCVVLGILYLGFVDLLERSGTLDTRDHGPIVLLFGTLLLLVSFFLPSLTLLWRQRRGACVRWDDWGVTEWDGRGIRAAIPWSLLRHHVETFEWRGRGMARFREHLLQITDGDRRRISMATALPRKNRFLRRRVVVKDRERFLSFVETVEARSRGSAMPIPWSQVDPRRPGRRSPSMWIGVVAGYPSVLLGVQESLVSPDASWAAVVVLVGGLALAVRSLRPLREVLAVSGEERLSRGDAPAVFDAERGSGDPYRGRAGRIPHVEPMEVRATRRTVLRAALVELALRLGLAVAVLAFAVTVLS